MSRLRRLLEAAIAIVLIAAPLCRAQAPELRLARQYGMGYLQMMVMEHERLIEKEAHKRGLSEVRVTWRTFGNGALANDAMLAGDIDVTAGGLGSFLTLWDRTRGRLGVKGIAALDSMPMLLNSRDPAVRTIRDLNATHRIALAGIKISSQATTLERAAAQAFGDAAWDRLDPLTVNLAHPAAMQALLSRKGEITAHFASPPFQYEELEHPGIHTILDSYQVWGGPQTFILAWTTSSFRERSPDLYAAVFAALADATDFINRDRRAAAVIYLAMTHASSMPVDTLARMLAKPQIRFTMTPERVLTFAQFKTRIGSVRSAPASWKDLFFPEIHDRPGS